MSGLMGPVTVLASIESAGPAVVVGATSVTVVALLTEVFAVLVAVMVTLVGAGYGV